MKLYEIITDSIGESYVRSYAWCETEEQAEQMFLRNHKHDTIKSIVLLFDSEIPAFVTDPDDSGFGKVRLEADQKAETRE